MSDVAGDPFEESNPAPVDDGLPKGRPNISAADRDGVIQVEGLDEEEVNDEVARLEAIQGLQDSHREPTEEMIAAQNVLDEFEAEKEAEAEAESEGSKLTLDEVRVIVRETAKAVEDATVNLEKAQKAYQIASLLEVEFSAKPTLAELNRNQVKVTATEMRRKARAMKALGELGFGDPKRKPHPPLFN